MKDQYFLINGGMSEYSESIAPPLNGGNIYDDQIIKVE